MKSRARTAPTNRRRPLHLLISLGLAFLLHSSPAQSQNVPLELIGVWQGTIGKRQIVACWDQTGGHYYPLRKPLRISLSPPAGENPHWIENLGIETSSTWQLDKPTGKRLTGTWRQSEAAPLSPIRLSRVKLNQARESQTPDCLFDSPLQTAFNAPRVAAQKITTGQAKVFMGRTYRVIQAMQGNVASVELEGDGEPIQRANKRLRQLLQDSIAAYLACDTFDPPRQGDWTDSVRLRFWNDDWLSWSEHGEWYCGGAHPSFNNETRVLNLHTGKEADLWSWFRVVKKSEGNPDQICDSRENRCLPKSLARRIAKTKPEVDKIAPCKPEDFDFGMVDGGYDIGLAPKGIAFIPSLPEPARIMRICYARYTIPFTDLQPYLTPIGKAAVAQILRGAAEPPAALPTPAPAEANNTARPD